MARSEAPSSPCCSNTVRAASRIKLGRGVLAEPGRRVSKQPGRCCAAGCEAPPANAAE